ncbi:hypothetical protein M3Y99_00476400 [Aphelenchoides fujianensis]|nr:hypothetical protein M3Y99_00476400 [Aphelenchoides fujianensis]
MAARPPVIRWTTATLLQIAAGTFVVGSTAIYVLQKQMQKKARQLPHYSEAFTIVKDHAQLKAALGEPIQIGQLDLADRRRNYVDKLESKLRIPISGPLDGGFLNVLATRADEGAEFKTKRLEFESDEGSFLVYES